MSNKYFDGIVKRSGVTADVDAELKELAVSTKAKVAEKMDKLRVADALTEIFTLFKRCNKYIDETTPWALAKNEEDKPRLAEVLYNLTESILIGASLLVNFLPETGKKIAEELGTTLRSIDELDKFGLYPDGGKVSAAPEILFARLDMKEVIEQVDAMYDARNAGSKPEESQEEEEPVIDIEAKPEISFEEFGKLQFQVGRIISCEAVKKSKKLLCSQVQVGSQVKQIVSGIKKEYSPEEMVGKKVMVLVNLKPAKLAGVLSEGMLLCAEDDKGQLSLIVPEKEMPAGAEIS